MWQDMLRRGIHITTLIVPGIFLGRVLAELAHLPPGYALMLTLLLAAAGAYVSHYLAPGRTLWLALPLAFYIFYPRARPDIALIVAAVCLLAALLLSQPLRNKRIALPPVGAVLIFFAALALYIHTLAPGLLPADNGELQLVAAQLGVAHPPGFALYTLIAHLATRIPIGPDAAYRVNLLSAFIAAATIGLTFVCAHELTGSRRAAFVAATALSTATTFWSQATTANVRILAAFFTVLALYFLLRYRRQHASSTADPWGRRLFPLAFTLSLGVTHHASLIFVALVFIIALLWLEPALLRAPRRWRLPLVGLLLGLLPLLYFPLRALTAVPAQNLRGVTPALATLPGFLQHVLALGFSGDLFAYTALADLLPRLHVMVSVMNFQFHPLLLLGMIAGFLLLLRKRPLLAFILGGSFALHTLITATYRAPQTVEYMLPAYIPAALLLAIAAAPLEDDLRLPPNAGRILTALFAALFLVVAVLQGLQRYPNYRQLSQDHTARRYTAPIFEQAPSNSTILAGWHWATPLWYQQSIAAQRPDLDIQYVFPTAEPYAETWARRIDENLAAGRSVVATHFDAAAYAQLQPARPIGDAFLFTVAPQNEPPESFTSLDISLGDSIQLAGYQLGSTELSSLREIDLVVAWRPLTPDTVPPITLFAHLVGVDDGTIYAQQDIPITPAAQGMTFTRLRLVPRPTAPPGDYRLFIGAYQTGDGQPLTAPGGTTRVPLQDISLEVLTQRPHTANPVYGPPKTAGERLVGYDWDQTLAPHTRLYLHWRTSYGYRTEVIDNPPPEAYLEIYGPWGVRRRIPMASPTGDNHYVPLGAGIVWTGQSRIAGAPPAPGDTLTLVQQFAASHPIQQDLVVSVRLIGYEPDGVHWAWWDLHDTVPALGAIPTLKWIDGSHVRDAHFLTVAPSAFPGQTLGALVTVYDAFTQQTLPILDERIAEQYPGIPLQQSSVR